MAKKNTSAQFEFVDADKLKEKIKQETAVQPERRVNPYKDYPLSACALLRAILCEIWELRQDIRSK